MSTHHLRKIAILAAILAILLAACGPQETETPEPTDIPAVIEQPTEVPTEVEELEETEEPTEADAESADDEEDSGDAEATDEADMDDEETEATEEADMDEMEEGAVVTFDDEAGFTFDYPDGYEATSTDNAVVLDMGEQRLVVITPAGWNAVLISPSDDNLENLMFFAESSGYTVGEEADMSMVDASINIELPRRDQVGFANLVDLGDGNFAVVIELGPDADSVPSADAAVISASLAYVPPPPPEEEEAPAEEEETSEEANLTIVGIALQTENLDTLATAVVRAGFLSTLNGEGPFTVFAPTDDAFAVALDTLGMTAEELFDDEELLTSVLTYHVIEDTVLSADLEDGAELETLNGAILTIGVSDDGVTVTDGTGTTYNVIAADVMASNGVVHVIDGVLLPPSE